MPKGVYVRTDAARASIRAAQLERYRAMTAEQRARLRTAMRAGMQKRRDAVAA